jgi:hypothetical protein
MYSHEPPMHVHTPRLMARCRKSVYVKLHTSVYYINKLDDIDEFVRENVHALS